MCIAITWVEPAFLIDPSKWDLAWRIFNGRFLGAVLWALYAYQCPVDHNIARPRGALCLGLLPLHTVVECLPEASIGLKSRGPYYSLSVEGFSVLLWGTPSSYWAIYYVGLWSFEVPLNAVL